MSLMGSSHKKIISLIVLLTMIAGYICITKPALANAATKYVTRGEMIQMILDELQESYDKSNLTDYITIAKKVGLINEKTFIKYDVMISKAEAAVLLVRADEHLNGKIVDEDLVKKIIDCRISDINKVRKGLRTYLAKSFALGYIKGNSNGVYSTNRKFNPNNKVTVTYAKKMVSLIHDKAARHKISPDGQVIRTTKLPKMAEFYPYILESYPNSYYDWKFLFMRTKIGDDLVYGTDRWVSKVDYASPKDFFEYENGEKVFSYYFSNKRISGKELYDECIDEWELNAKKYLECVFNIDYRSIKNNKTWKEKLLNSDFNGVNDKANTMNKINNFIESAIENKTIVKSKFIAVDRSSLYISNEFIYLRAYVRYNVVSSKNLDCQRKSPIIFTRFTYPEFQDLKVGEWRDCYVNIMVSSGVPNYGVECLCLNDYFYDSEVIDK